MQTLQASLSLHNEQTFVELKIEGMILTMMSTAAGMEFPIAQDNRRTDTAASCENCGL